MKAVVLRNVFPKSSSSSSPDIEPDFELRFAKLKTSKRVRLIFVAIILGLGLILRLESIRTAAPHPDEHHWVERSALLASHLQAGSYGSATTHLGHPGIPAAVFMAAGQSAARYWNAFAGAKPYTRFYLDGLSASRLSTLCMSSLVLLVLVFSSSRLIGLTAVLLGTMFLTLDPQHIALSRLAHLDGVLTLCATICLLLGLSAEREDLPSRKIVAGVFWGLAIASKPTALALVPILLAYKFIRRGIVQRYSQKRLPLLDWSDVWAVLAGHVVLGALYTKLWIPDNTYLTKHKINPPLVGAIVDFGGLLASMPVLPLAIAAAMALCAWNLFASVRPGAGSRLSFHLSMAFLVLGFTALMIWISPITSSNMVRFWYWVGGLSRRNHEAYGIVKSPPGWGYPEIWFRRLPSLVVIGWFVSLPLLVAKWRRITSRKEAEETAFLLLLLIAPFIWTLPLSVSAKQSVRYLVPIYPAVFLLSAWGMVQLWRRIASTSLIPAVDQSVRRWVPYVSAVALTAAQFFIVRSWAPNYALYYNWISGGARAAVERGFNLVPIGYEKALEMMHQVGLESGRRPHVEVVGDYDLIAYAYSRLHPKQQGAITLDIHNYRDGMGADWVLEFTSFSAQRDWSFDNRRIYEPVLVYEEHGAPVYRLYKVHAYDFPEPTVFPVRHGARQTGSLREFEPDVVNVYVSPRRSRSGYIHFDQFARLLPGKYRVVFTGAKAPEAVKLADLEPEREIVRVELSSRCSRLARFRDINSFKLQPIEFECEFSTPTRAQLSMYWYGNFPIRMGDITIVRIP